ncbi:MAG: hypothetical protein ACREOO_29340 [bacterium]
MNYEKMNNIVTSGFSFWSMPLSRSYDRQEKPKGGKMNLSGFGGLRRQKLSGSFSEIEWSGVLLLKFPSP